MPIPRSKFCGNIVRYPSGIIEECKQLRLADSNHCAMHSKQLEHVTDTVFIVNGKRVQRVHVSIDNMLLCDACYRRDIDGDNFKQRPAMIGDRCVEGCDQAWNGRRWVR